MVLSMTFQFPLTAKTRSIIASDFPRQLVESFLVPIALLLLRPLSRRELKRGAGEDLPLGRSNTALEHGVLGLDVEVHYVAIWPLQYLSDAESKRDVLHMVKGVKRPDSRRSDVESAMQIADNERLHRRELANRA